MTSQRVREAAEDAYLTCFEDVPNPAWMAALIAGKHDDDPVVQAFARFDQETALRVADAMKERAANEYKIKAMTWEQLGPRKTAVARQGERTIRAIDTAALVKEVCDAD